MKAQAQKRQRQPVDDNYRWQLYETLKARYTADAENQREYEDACHRAAQEARV